MSLTRVYACETATTTMKQNSAVTPGSVLVPLCSPPFPPPFTPGNLLRHHRLVCIFWKCIYKGKHVNGSIHSSVSSSDRMILNCIRVAVSVFVPFTTPQSTLWGVGILFTHSSVDGHLGPFQFGSIMNKATKNIHRLTYIHSLCEQTFSFLSSKYRGYND